MGDQDAQNGEMAASLIEAKAANSTLPLQNAYLSYRSGLSEKNFSPINGEGLDDGDL